jgi:CRP-like cAMP-binding protein
MQEVLRQSELFAELDDLEIEHLETISKLRSLRAEEYLFLLGDSADRLYVVLSGKIKTCFPLSLNGVMQDVTVESKGPGDALGWSALVRPYRFTLSARAAGPCEVAGFPRQELLRVMEGDPRLGLDFNKRLAEVIGNRLLKMQALWGRELQRAVSGGLGA